MTPKELWDLDNETFNVWRRENDLKKLFECFSKTLPLFDDWLETNKISVEFILQTDKPGRFFHGDMDLYFLKSKKNTYFENFFIPIESPSHEKKILALDKSQSSKPDKYELFRFSPYFKWASEKLGTNKLIETKYSSKLETFRYIGYNAPDVPESSSASIAPGFSVLKLGGVKLEGWGMQQYRNLDFTNLDFLEIEGEDYWDREHKIYYSSCRKIKFNKSALHFTSFHECHFENLTLINTKFYNVGFYYCDFFQSYFENAKLLSLTMEYCSISDLSFNRVEVSGLNYVPTKKQRGFGVLHTYGSVSDVYKRLRMLYQSNGHRKETGESYYLERYYGMMYNWGDRTLLKSIKEFSFRELKPSFIYVWYNLKKLFHSLSEFSSFLIWGYGERPINTVFASVLILFIYSMLYYFSSIHDLSNNFINSLYVSMAMFTTLGFGDSNLIPQGWFRLVFGSEALIGAFILGLFIVGYSNKSKY